MCTLVASLIGVLNVAHIARDARNAEHTTLLIKVVGHLLWLLTELLHDVRHGACVDVTRTTTHHQTCQRGESHRRIDDLTIEHGGHTGTIADVTSNDFAVVIVESEELGGTLRHVSVARSVEAIAAHMVLFV